MLGFREKFWKIQITKVSPLILGPPQVPSLWFSSFCSKISVAHLVIITLHPPPKKKTTLKKLR